MLNWSSVPSPIADGGDRQKTADSVEKVGFLKLLKD
jgi:hypothetical protein